MEEDEPQKAFDPELNNNMRCFEIVSQSQKNIFVFLR